MTDQELLDHFAGCALTGLVQCYGIAMSEIISKEAYKGAAAMMAERKNHIADTGKMIEPARLECIREKCKKFNRYRYCMIGGCARYQDEIRDKCEPVEADND